MTSLRRAALPLVNSKRILLVRELVLRVFALAAHLLDVGLVIVNLGLEFLLRFCGGGGNERRRFASALSSLRQVTDGARQSDPRRTRKFAETGQQIVQIVLVHLATVSKRFDLADDVLVLRRLVEKVLVVCDEFGDPPFELFVVALFDRDLGRDLLEVLAELGVENQALVSQASQAVSTGPSILTLYARSRSVLNADSFSLSTLMSTVCSFRMRLISSSTFV